MLECSEVTRHRAMGEGLREVEEDSDQIVGAAPELSWTSGVYSLWRTASGKSGRWRRVTLTGQTPTGEDTGNTVPDDTVTRKYGTATFQPVSPQPFLRQSAAAVL